MLRAVMRTASVRHRCRSPGLPLALLLALLGGALRGQTPAGPLPPTGPAAALRARFLGEFALPAGGTLEVGCTEDGLLVRGIGLQASVRLLAGRWPARDKAAEQALERGEARAMALLLPIVRGEGAAADVAFAGAEAGARARQAIAAAAQRVGADPELQFVGTESGAQPAAWFRLRGRNGGAWLRATWGAQRRFQSLVEAREPPFHAEFKLVRADVAAAVIQGHAVTLTVEGEGAGRVLVLEDASPGAAGLCEFRWRADLH